MLWVAGVAVVLVVAFECCAAVFADCVEWFRVSFPGRCCGCFGVVDVDVFAAGCCALFACGFEFVIRERRLFGDGAWAGLGELVRDRFGVGCDECGPFGECFGEAVCEWCEDSYVSVFVFVEVFVPERVTVGEVEYVGLDVGTDRFDEVKREAVA